QAPGERSAFGVEDDLLEERLADPLRDAAVHLSLHQPGIDDGATVVDGHMTDEAGLAGLHVDLRDRKVSAEGIARFGEDVGLPFEWRAPALLRRQGKLAPAHRGAG